MLIIVLVPGFYISILLGKIGLKLDEILIINILLSSSLVTFVTIYISYFTSNITDIQITLGLLIVVLISCIFCLPVILKNNGNYFKSTYREAIIASTSLIVSFLIGFYLVYRYLPEIYWRGWDPWLLSPVMNVILEQGLNPSELVDTGLGNLGVSGFFYFLASLKAVTGFSGYTLIRFGGPVLSGIGSSLTFVLIKRSIGQNYGLIASAFLFLNPFFVGRFSMTLRENFAWLFLITIVLFLSIVKDFYYEKLLYYFLTIFIICTFISTCLISHSLSSIMVYGIIFFEIIGAIFQKKIKYIFVLIYSIVFSLIISFPYIRKIYEIYNWILINQAHVNYIIFIPLVIFILIITYFTYDKFIDFIKNNIKIVIILIIFTILGAFNSLIFPKTFPLLGSYNPPIILNNFSLTIILLSFIGILITFWTNAPIIIVSFSMIILLLSNLPNINIAFPLFRLIIYISWILTYFAVKGLKEIYHILENKINSTINIIYYKRSLKLNSHNLTTILFTMLLILTTPMLIHDLTMKRNYYSYYSDEDVISAQEFAKNLKETDLIIPQGWTQDLLLYVGINVDTIVSGSTLQELYSAQTMSSIMNILENHFPNVTKVFVFMIERRVNRASYAHPSIELLDSWGEKKQLGSLLIYTVNLHDV